MWCARRKLRTFPLMGLRHAERIGEVAMKAKTILEYGSGGSTLWLAQIAPDASILSIESEKNWYDRVRAAYNAIATGGIAVGHVSQYYVPALSEWVDAAAVHAPFGMILIDGVHETRDPCLRGAFDLLNPGGTVFLHDAEEPDYQAGIDAFHEAGGLPCAYLGHDRTFGPARLWIGTKPC